jgi:hypothetical protein
MKQVYVCGDSFCVSDLEYGQCWVDLLAQHRTVINLAQVSATNLLISQQVDQAIAESADFVIVQGTSCTRSETRFNGQVVPYSFLTANTTTTKFNNRQLQIIREYYTEFFDLDLAIYHNQCIIQNTLQKLMDSGIPFRFDQGGFEHPKFGAMSAKYFAKFEHYRSAVNLWDHADTKDYRPYYHIRDDKVHQHVAQYYIKETE